MQNQILNTEQPTNREILLYDVSYYIHHILKKTQYTDVMIGIAKDPNANDESIHYIIDSDNIIYVSLAFMDKVDDFKTDLITELYVGLANTEEEVKNSLNTPNITLGKFNSLNIVSIEVGGNRVGGSFRRESLEEDRVEDKHFKINKSNMIRLKKDTIYSGMTHREKFVNQCLNMADYIVAQTGSERDGLVRLPICAISEVTNVVNTLKNKNLHQFDMANVIAYSEYGLKESVYKNYRKDSATSENLARYKSLADAIIKAAEKLNTSITNKTAYEILKNTGGFDRSLKESGISVFKSKNGIVDRSTLEALRDLLKRCYNLYAGLYTGDDRYSNLKGLMRMVEQEQVILFVLADVVIGGSTDSRHALYICGKDDTNSYLFVHDPNSLNTNLSSISIMHKLDYSSNFRHLSRTIDGSQWLVYKSEYVMTARNATPSLLESSVVDELDEPLKTFNTSTKNEIDPIEAYRLRAIPTDLNLRALSTGLLDKNNLDIYNKREAITLAIMFRLIESDFSDVQNPLYTPISAHDIDYILNGAIGSFWDNIRLLLLVRGYNGLSCGNPEYTENKKINTLKDIFNNGRWVILLCDKYDETNTRVGTYSILCTSIEESDNNKYIIGYDYIDNQIQRIKIDVTGKSTTAFIHYFVKEYIANNEVTRKCVPKKLITNIGSPFRTDYTPYNK